MKQTFYAFLATLLISVPLFSTPMITLTGSAISGASAYKQENSEQAFRGQFESATDILVGLEFSDQVSALIDLGFGAAPNVSRFVSGAELFGLTITVSPKNFFNTSITLGFMTIPFGQFAEEQSANAIISSPFIYNDLGVALLSSGSSLLNFGSSGALTTTSLRNIGTINLMVFNGTHFTASNPDKGFGFVARYINDQLIDNLSVGFSYMNSNDKGNSAGLDANTTGYSIDFKSEYFGLEYGGAYTILTLDDYNAATLDDVNTYMFYVSRGFDGFTLAARYSAVAPKDFNGDGSGISSAMPVVGLGNTSSDIDTTRIQVAGVFHLDDYVNFHNELIFDTYGENRTGYNNIAALSYVAVNF
tara:strand:+ start:164 stop:1243 length:1080 start_codon:yes stop_codon:yes gene_type:complete